MITTGRGHANDVPASHVPQRPKKRKKTSFSTSGDVAGPVTVLPRGSQDPPLPAHRIALDSGLNGLHVTSRRTKKGHEQVLQSKFGKVRYGRGQSSINQSRVSLQELVADGSPHNPIVVLQDSPSPTPRRDRESHVSIEPHQFKRRNRRLHDNTHPRKSLTSKMANGGTSTTHSGQNIYRMCTTKTALPVTNLSEDQPIRLPFEMQYPVSAQYLVHQPNGVYPLARPQVQYYAQPSLSHLQVMSLPKPSNEVESRREAVKYVTDYSRLSPHQRKTTQKCEGTNKSGSEEIQQGVTFRSSGTKLLERPDSRASLMECYNNNISSLSSPLKLLIERGSRLNSLLRAYAQSGNQEGFREEIAMLASLQNQDLADWLRFESRKDPKPVDLYARSGINCITGSPTRQPRFQQNQDVEIRSLLSADAQLWQDGSGLGVADVYAGTRASTPATSLEVEKHEGEEGTAVVSRLNTPS